MAYYYGHRGPMDDVEQTFRIEDRIRDEEEEARRMAQEQQLQLYHPTPNAYPQYGQDNYSMQLYYPPPPPPPPAPARYDPQPTYAQPPNTYNFYPTPDPYCNGGGYQLQPQPPPSNTTYKDSHRTTNKNNSYASSDNRDNHHSNNIAVHVHVQDLTINIPAHKPRNSFNIKFPSWRGKKVKAGGGAGGGGAMNNLAAAAVQGGLQGTMAAFGAPAV
ncbi:hypothetical protein EG329_014183 [Mollisiaceae sp. DMI_Dod_QoI]|nr:hypothetical protein EG329_014183 [Helotiales sp. DMI_Dod_QoI]